MRQYPDYKYNLLVAAVILLLSPASGLLATDVNQSDLKLCAGLATAALKLACFEALVAAEDAEDAETAETAENAASEPVVTSAAESRESATEPTAVIVPPAPAPVVEPRDLGVEPAVATTDAPVPVDDIAVRIPVEAVTTGAAVEAAAGDSEVVASPADDLLPAVAAERAAAVAADAALPVEDKITVKTAPASAADPVGNVGSTAVNGVAGAAPVMPIATAASPDSKDFGSEQVEHASADEEDVEVAIRATVLEVTKKRNNVLYFRLEDGNVWRQIEGRRFRYPRDGQFEVIISRGMMGDYRLRLKDKSPMTRIRLIQ